MSAASPEEARLDVIIDEGMCDQSGTAVITAWLCDDGDRVERGAVIAEVMVEKAQLELTAPASGTLHIRVSHGSQPLKCGDVVATIS